MKEMSIGNGQLVLVEGDITKQEADAIVNAANSGLMGGGGVDGAIHRAGGPAILEECKKIIRRIGRLDPGKAVITTGGNLKAKHVIHTVGPVYSGGGEKDKVTLASCYLECLKLAKKEGLRTIAFPSISTGAYGYPLRDAAVVAFTTIMDFMESKEGEGIDAVTLVLFGEEAYKAYELALSQVMRWMR